METRKVQKVGGGTYTVSLPKEWAESEGVEAGTVVDLHAHIDGLLVIQTRDREEDPADRVRVSAADAEPAWLERLLRAAYAAGAESIVFDAPDGLSDEGRRTVERVARDLAGVTVAEVTDTGATVRTPLDPSEVSIRQSVRQLRFVALSMHRDATAALTADSATDDLADRDAQADRLCGLIERHVERGLGRLDEVDDLGLTRPELFALWGTARELERVADHAERLLATARAVDDPPDESLVAELTDVAETARGVVEDGVDVTLGDAGVDDARRALAARDRVRADCRSLDRRLVEASSADGRYLRILDGLRRTAEHGGNVAERGLRAAVRRGAFDGAGGDVARDVDPHADPGA